LGLPITERAFGPDALAANFAIIAVHSPICYAIGITTMEAVLNRGGRLRDTVARVWRGMTHNPLVIAIALGFLVNLTGLALPNVLNVALDMAYVFRPGEPKTVIINCPDFMASRLGTLLGLNGYGVLFGVKHKHENRLAAAVQLG
jgi:hypothetical protein